MVMDYEDIVELAQIDGVPVRTLLAQFKGCWHYLIGGI